MSNTTPSLDTVLNTDTLEDTFPEYEGQLVDTITDPPREADRVSATDVLPDTLAEPLEHDLYSHQAAAIQELQAGNNVTVSTSTSSGKTWIYTLYFCLRKLQNPDARALFLYPTKALSADQERAINDLFNKLGIDAFAETYDGDTKDDRKKLIRDRVDVVISNFAGMNQYLESHMKWRDVFQNCELVAVDECHTYTGVHGMHVAWVIRRLRRLLDHYGSDPQFVCSTATIGNPREHSELLTGTDFQVIDDDGSPHGRREIAFWEPPLQETDGPVDELGEDEILPSMRRNADDEAAGALVHLAKNDVQTLMFTDSRQGTEIGVKRAIEAARNHPESSYVDIDPYHAGLSKRKRRAVENKLSSSDLDGVISTSALELGIDIGSMDATVLAGYPGTRQSFWQRIGRAGRGTTDSLSVYVPQSDAIDQYILDNPEYVLEENVEDAVVDLSNNPVYAKHVLCAASERPLTEADAEWFGLEDRLARAIDMWQAAGQMVGDLDRGAQYNGSARPQSDISMYATTDEQYKVRQEDGDIDMEPLDKERVYREFYPGALVLHDGDQYEVQEVVEDRIHPYVTVEESHSSNYTQAIHDKQITDLEIDRSYDLGNGYQLCAGMGTVHINYSAYNVLNIHTGEVVEPLVPIDLDPIYLRTQLMWIAFPDQAINQTLQEIPSISYLQPDEGSEFASMGEEEYTITGGLHGGEHGMIKMAPLELRLDNSDMGGLSTLYHSEVGSAVWFIHDAVEGGIGFAHSIYENFEAVAQRTLERIDDCDCGRDVGCPACLMSSQCGNQNEPLHRPAAVSLLGKAINQVETTTSD
ncbi:DEAD/DEAH box helicase [Natrinema salsiterrestre]|uniref:DEAD/DEAH box helicase n=1 Tax=Natrinema salsiterrestre TaxID=2950540 RepID=A0A9Q4L0U4_9EURY|nr:DEAD/DEAH box helicase [Natrinema salsiterrestre]MDF9747925.1 DEAD/DEAH box helicase [Natrinema salsiterrestre]